MDTILLTITGFSLLVAAAMGALVARLRRDERRRSDARVALLMNAAVRSGDLELRPVAATPTVADLFHGHDEGSAWPRRLGIIAAMGALMAVVIFGWKSIVPDVPAPAARGASAGSLAPDPRVGPAAAAPLELLSLAHQQQQGSLTISGVVQNPRSGTPLGRVHATVLVFGGDGALLTSARAPLDTVILAPGVESPFVIHVPVASAARYRVGFRGENDQALGHVDRRDPEALARQEVP